MYLLLGQAELRNSDPAKAEAAFQKAIDLDKNNITAFLLLANTEVTRGSVDQAIANVRPRFSRIRAICEPIFFSAA